MGVEAEGFISDLDPTMPAGGDRISQGDDHIRLIKKDIQNTFPNVTGEVTVTHEELNQLAGVTQPIVDLIQIGDDAIVALDIRVTKNEEDIVDLQGRVDTLEDHTINDHPDVDTSQLEDGAIMMWDGTKWVAKKVQLGGGMLTMVQQPSSAGDCNYEPSGQRYIGSLSGTNDTCTLTVPNGMVFVLNYFFGGVPEIDSDAIVIDGVNVSSSNIYNGHIDTPDKWPSDNGGTTIKVTQSITVKSHSGSGSVYFHGMFVEAD